MLLYRYYQSASRPRSGEMQLNDATSKRRETSLFTSQDEACQVLSYGHPPVETVSMPVTTAFNLVEL